VLCFGRFCRRTCSDRRDDRVQIELNCNLDNISWSIAKQRRPASGAIREDGLPGMRHSLPSNLEVIYVVFSV
jgi:hypothetical protein